MMNPVPADREQPGPGTDEERQCDDCDEPEDGQRRFLLCRGAFGMSCEAEYPQARQLHLQEIGIEIPFLAILVAESYGFGVQRLEDGISRLDAVGLVILANADDARQSALECTAVPGAVLSAPPAQFPRPDRKNRGRRRDI